MFVFIRQLYRSFRCEHILVTIFNELEHVENVSRVQTRSHYCKIQFNFTNIIKRQECVPRLDALFFIEAIHCLQIYNPPKKNDCIYMHSSIPVMSRIPVLIIFRIWCLHTHRENWLFTSLLINTSIPVSDYWSFLCRPQWCLLFATQTTAISKSEKMRPLWPIGGLAYLIFFITER